MAQAVSMPEPTVGSMLGTAPEQFNGQTKELGTRNRRNDCVIAQTGIPGWLRRLAVVMNRIKNRITKCLNFRISRLARGAPFEFRFRLPVLPQVEKRPGQYESAGQ